MSHFLKLNDDDKLRGFLTLKKALKPLIDSLEEMADYLKERGSFSTTNYVCSIDERKRTGIISLSEAIDMLGKEAVEEAGLIRVSYFKIISVTEKSTKVSREYTVK